MLLVDIHAKFMVGCHLPIKKTGQQEVHIVASGVQCIMVLLNVLVEMLNVGVDGGHVGGKVLEVGSQVLSSDMVFNEGQFMIVLYNNATQVLS